MDKSGLVCCATLAPVTFISIHSSPQQGCQLSVVLSFQVGAKLNIHAKYVLGVRQFYKTSRNVGMFSIQHSHFVWGCIPLIMQHIWDILGCVYTL